MKRIQKRIESAIRNNQRFLITSHIRPDGDSVGSQLALYWALVNQGKKVAIQNADPVPDTYKFLQGADLIRISTEVENSWDVLFVLDVGDIERTGGITAEKISCVVNIDHHHSRKPFADISFVREEASSTCELIYELLKVLGLTINPLIANCLYTGIVCDTGSFRFSNTSERVFETASDLVRLGANPSAIAQKIYEENSHARIRMLGECLSKLELTEDGKIASVTVDQEMLKRNGCQPWETESFVNYAQSIKGVVVALLFYELSPGKYKISLRSGGEVNVAAVAEELEGGGHKCASGCRIEGSRKTIKENIITRIRQRLNAQ